MRVVVLGFILLFSSCLRAETLQIEYSRFYSHVKKLSGDDTQALRFAFGFLRVGQDRLCHVKNARIVTDKQTLPVDVSAEYRFSLPSDKILKMADAVVEVELEEPANVCDMSVQLETRPEYLKRSYTKKELRFLFEQYQAFFNEMGSFLSFMMPSVEGLTFQFEDKSLSRTLKDAPPINMGTLLVSEEWIRDNKGLTLPVAPMRITAKAN